MKHASKLLSAAGTLALMGLAATPAFATGTTAGSSILNTATISFQVGGVAQTPQNASNSIVVDEKVSFTAVEQGATTSVSPGQTGAVTTFSITNNSNAALEIGIAAAAQANGATVAPGTGTSSVTATGFTYATNTNGSTTCSYSAGNATTITDITSLAANASQCVYVLANIPVSATSGQIAGINLTATAESAPGVALTQSNSSVAWTPGTMQIVFADGTGNGTGDANYDGKYTALANYTVAAPILTVSKVSWISADGIETSNFKAIPGATLNYCIIVSNAGPATASATNLSISDPLPATVPYVTGTNKLNATVTGSGATATCSAGTAGADAVAGTVSGTLATLAPGASEGLWFQATIN